MFEIDSWIAMFHAGVKLAPWWIGLIVVLAAQAWWERREARNASQSKR